MTNPTKEVKNHSPKDKTPIKKGEDGFIPRLLNLDRKDKTSDTIQQEIISARQCMDFQTIKCNNKECKNKFCPLNKKYD